MKTKIISILLSSLMIISAFSGCNNSEEKTLSSENDSSGELVSEPENKNSENDSSGEHELEVENNTFKNETDDNGAEGREDIDISESNQYPPEISSESNDISNEMPLVTERVVIDSLGKLAYYSGLTVLYNNGYLTENRINSWENEKSPMEFIGSAKETSQSDWNIGIDTSEQDIAIEQNYSEETEIIPPIDFSPYPPYVAPEYFPIDPGFEGDIYIYAVYEITISSVRYFKINLTLDDNYLAKQVGTGILEVMVLNLTLSGIGEEQMLVVRNGNRYFSCLTDSYYVGENYSQFFGFTAAKYVSNFSVVKAPDLSEYNFGIAYRNDDYGSMIDFVIEGGPYVEVFQDSYVEYLDFEPYTITAHGLDKEMYNLYVQNIIAGVIEPIMPEMPSEIIPPTNIWGFENSGFEVNSKLNDALGETGQIIYKGNEENVRVVIEAFPNSNFKERVESLILADVNFGIMWIKGRGRISGVEIKTDDASSPALMAEYIRFDSSDVYTLFIFEVNGISEIIQKEVNYSSSVVATFSSIASDGTEHLIHLCNDGSYRIETSNSTELNYVGFYKISDGQICLAGDGFSHYIDISSDSSIEYDGRIYKLLS